MFGLENSVVDSLMIRSENHFGLSSGRIRGMVEEMSWPKLTQIDLGLHGSIDWDDVMNAYKCHNMCMPIYCHFLQDFKYGIGIQKEKIESTGWNRLSRQF